MQFESLAGFSAVIDRLGQFQEVMARQKGSLALPAEASETGSGDRSANTEVSNSGSIEVQYLPLSGGEKPRLASLQALTVCTPDRSCVLVKDLSLKVGIMLHAMSPHTCSDTGL